MTDPVTMEVRAGARDDRHLLELRGLLGRADMLHCVASDGRQLGAGLRGRTRRATATMSIRE